MEGMIETLVLFIILMTLTPDLISGSCDSGWTHKPEVGKCYRAYDSYQSYQGAKTNCENVGATLAMPKTQELQDALASILEDKEYWIGLERLTGSTDTWLDGTSVSWSYICPCDSKQSSCAAYRTLGSYYSGNHYWADTGCSAYYVYVCEKSDGTSGAGAVANTCPSGWTHKASVNRCYWPSGSTTATYENAKVACAATSGATIAMPKTAEQQAAMAAVLSSAEHWIGLEHMGSNPDQWADGTTPTYVNICSCDSRGNANCNAYRAHNSYSFQWMDRSCNYNYRYVCEIIVNAGCSAPSSPAHTTEVVAGTNTGDSITYTCVSGTTHSSGNLVRVCQSDRTWNGSAPVCQAITCSTPSAPTDTTQVVAGTNVGDSITYSCVSGTTHSSGNLVRSCQSDGTWDGSAPVCQAITCTTPSTPTDTTQVVAGTNVGDSITYSCVSGTTHSSGNLVRSCQSDGTWDGSAPVCQAITCTTPSSPTDTTQVVAGTNVGDSITYSCVSGTTHSSGNLVRSCQSDGTWDGSAPVCEEPSICPSGWTFVPSVGRCYRHSGSDTQTYENAKTTCQGLNGTIAMPKTAELQAGMSTVLENYNYYIGLERYNGGANQWADGTALSYSNICSCDNWQSGTCAAYRTLGTSYLSHGGPHLWADNSCSSSLRYVCEISVEQCPLPAMPANASQVVGGLRIGDNITYSCDAGSALKRGDLVRECRDNGAWSGREPECEGYIIEVQCEGGTVSPQCPVDYIIHIVDALYGRTNTNTCPSSAIRTTDCNATRSYSVVAAACEGQQSCSVVANIATFSQDPCSGTYKYLQIHYRCTGDAHPVAFWPLDANSLGTDLSGNGHHGTVHNVSPSPGPYGHAHALTFAEASDSHVVIPAHAQLSVQSFTLMFFMYLENLDASCLFEYASNPVASHIWVHPNGQSLKVNLIDLSDPNLQHYSQVNNIFSVRTWHRVVVSFSQTTGELTVESEVFDTQQVTINTTQLGTFTHHTNGLNLQIGKRQGVATEMFDGRLSCVQLFDDVIDADSKDAAWERCQERGNLACNAPDDGINAAYSGNLTMGSVVSYTCNTGASYASGDSNRTCLTNLTWSGTRMECQYDLQQVAFWPFDGNSLGNDLTGRGHHGALSNVIAAPGPFGALHALEFTASSLSHITVPAHSDLAVRSFTLIWLMNPVSVSSSTRAVLFEFGVDQPHIWQWDAGPHLYANLVDTGNQIHVSTFHNAFSANTWQKVIVQYDRDTGTVLLGSGTLDSYYFNNSTAVLGQFDLNTAHDFHVGKRLVTNDPAYAFNGRLSCVHLFDAAVDLQTINEAWELCRARGNVSCSAPEPGVNATYSGNLTMGSVVTYSCNVGHVYASGDVTRTCQGDLTWSGAQMECEVVICSDPGFISNSARLPAASQTFYGGNNVTYTCNSGYVEANGSLSRVCQDNSTWSGDPLFCEAIPVWSTPCYGDWGHGYYGHCYILNTSVTSWEAANDDCHRLGGYIWVPETIDERDYVDGLSTQTLWWVGITDPWYTEATVPLSGSLLKDHIFMGNEPDELDKVYFRLTNAGIKDSRSLTGRKNICEQSRAFLGCYRTDSSLTATLSSPLHMNLQQCIEYCRGQSRAYASVSSSECYCTQTVTEANKENDFTLCNTKCPGNKHQFCGGNGYVSMYLVTWISVVASSCDVLYKNGVREYGHYWVAAAGIDKNIRVECFTSSPCNEWLINQISDSSISASSSRSNLSHTDIRLYGESGWGPNVSADTNGSWVQFSLPNRYIVTGFKTQGRNDIDQLERVQNFTVQYRDTSIGGEWRLYRNNSYEDVFDARGPTSTDFNTPAYNEVENPFVATDIRVLPETSSCLGTGCVLRLDVSGCQFDTFSETVVDVGCFLDDPDHPEFPTILSSGITLTSECRELCAQGGHLYAAVTNGTVCGCGNQIGKYGKTRKGMCDIACTGNPRDACGGELFNSVFRVWSVKCPELPQKPNMALNTTERSHGDVAKYTCLPGYRLPSGTNETDVLRCVQKQWVGDIPAQGCERIVCNGALPAVANATRTDTGNFLDSTATYRCFFGFLYPDNSDVQQIRCQDTGAWSSLSHTECQERLCSAPPDVANATAVFNNRTWTFTCDAGYAVSAGDTTQTLFCNLQGQWEGSVENCEGQITMPGVNLKG